MYVPRGRIERRRCLQTETRRCVLLLLLLLLFLHPSGSRPDDAAAAAGWRTGLQAVIPCIYWACFVLDVPFPCFRPDAWRRVPIGGNTDECTWKGGRDGKGEWRAGRAEPGNEETRAESIAGGACARCWSVPGHPTGSALLRSGLQRINGRVAEPSHPTTRHGDLVASAVSVPLRFLFQFQFQSSAGGPPDACLAVDNTHNSPNTDSVHDLCACRRLHPYTTQDRPTETQCRLRWMLPSRLRWLGWVMCPPSVLDALVLKAAQQQPSHKTSLFLLW